MLRFRQDEFDVRDEVQEGWEAVEAPAAEPLTAGPTAPAPDSSHLEWKRSRPHPRRRLHRKVALAVLALGPLSLAVAVGTAGPFGDRGNESQRVAAAPARDAEPSRPPVVVDGGARERSAGQALREQQTREQEERELAARQRARAARAAARARDARRERQRRRGRPTLADGTPTANAVPAAPTTVAVQAPAPVPLTEPPPERGAAGPQAASDAPAPVRRSAGEFGFER